jgi:hypothetical protein
MMLQIYYNQDVIKMKPEKEPEKIPLGETRIGVGPYIVGGVKTNAVIVLRACKGYEAQGADQEPRLRPGPSWDEVAVMNLDGIPKPKTYAPVEKLVEDYVHHLNTVAGADEEITPDSIEALVFGGNFVEHRAVSDAEFVHPRAIIEGTDFLVSMENTMMKKNAMAALDVLELGSVRYKSTDVLATKTLTVERGGYVTIKGVREGLNSKPAAITETEYDEWKSRQCCSD